ncbi:PREDICTED: uncharacterized protein LOC105366966 [Ceratosolen solmsi marchali]|uniref:Uncharacterized protein LOC105366966 n=1 Tax=Ceratosolen solmsi marchali TaxID=326594 RepID=A0AAJ6YTD0_9HYME|nr:PREDICTED: uncharacterized protein LOC105366966 [Ceratosolen solmsi marchali]
MEKTLSQFMNINTISQFKKLQNRKILEELQLKKQLLLKQGVAQTLGTSISVATTATSTSLPQILVSNDGITINSLQRAALLNAHAASAGYFVTQDSSFGNLILPVLPRFEGKFEKFFETVVMNPPFGTKCNRGIDIKFLEIASKIAKNTIYSLHKSSTRDYVLKKGFQFGFNCQVLAELVYDLPQTYKFHKKKFVNIKVDFIRFSAMK